MSRLFLLLPCGWLLASLALAGAPSPARITLLEGNGVLIRGTTRYALAEGLPVRAGDILETGEKAVAQVELGGGTLFALGPASRALVTPGAATGSGDVFVLAGQIKAVAANGALRVATPEIVAGLTDATLVAQIGKQETGLFVESGEVKVAEAVSGKKPAASVAVKSGEFHVRRAGGRGEISKRPPANFVGGLPRVFLDNLNPRLARFAQSPVEPKNQREITYDDVAGWLKGPPEVRRPLVARWHGRARDPAFRAALVANLKQHPEWDRILFPEKYRKPDGDAKPAAKNPLNRG